MRRVWERLADVAMRRSALVLVVATALAVLSAFAATRLRLNPEMVAFLPESNRAVADFRRIVGAMGAIDHHVVMITVPKGLSANEYEPLVAHVAAEYEKLPFVASVDSRLPDADSLVSALLPHALLLLSPAELDQVAGKLSDASIRESMQQNRMLLQTPQAFVAKDLVRLDPLQLRSVLLARTRSVAGGMRLDATSRFLRSADGFTFLVVVRPKRPAQDIQFVSELMKRSHGIEMEAIRAAAPLQPPDFEYAGGYAITHADAELIRGDMIANVLFSVIGVLVLFLFAFRRPAAIAYAALPMILAILATYAIAAVILGELGSASAGFAALLAGLGIDFTTVLYGRFLEERKRGAPVTDALRETLTSTMPGVSVAALTTAATFYGFLFTDFRGMAQMGFLTGTGILLFLVAVAFVVPALMARFERDGRPARDPSIHVFGMGKLIEWSVAYPRIVLAIWGGFVILMSAAATRLEFSDDAGRLRARGNRGIVAQERLSRLFGRGGDPAMIVAESPTLEGAMKATEELEPGLRRLASQGTIGGFESLASFLPSPQQQLRTIHSVRARAGGAFNAQRIRATFVTAATENGFRAETWSGFLDALESAVAPAKPLTPFAFEDPWLRRFAERFVTRANDRWMSIVYLHPPGGRWHDGAPVELQQLVEGRPDVTLTGLTVVSAELRRIARSDAIRATAIGTVMVMAILTIAFRSISGALLIFVPFLAGLVGMFGAMALLGLEMNLMNIFIGLMLVGVATDYAVYVLQRFHESPDDFAVQAPETGKAVIMAALTAVVGYGSFALSHYPGLQSIGYAATFGIGLSALAAVTLLPAMLVGTRRVRNGRGTPPVGVSLLDT